jgi:1-acyl-sn-glycerol-3-phosphate acyltransferase
MLRLAWRAPALLALILVGLLILVFAYRLFSQQRRDHIRCLWSRMLLEICGLKVALIDTRGTGQPLSGPASAQMIVLNHVSWLDIFVLNSVTPATFVAKSEIRSWPLIGWLVAGAGTVFVERGSRHKVRLLNHEITRRLQAGQRVAFFPEGKTTNGFGLLPFHTSLFAAALHEDQSDQLMVPIQPAALRYFQDGQASDCCAYIDDQTLVGSMVRILTAAQLSVELEYLPEILTLPRPVTRHAVAAKAEAMIRQAVHPA